MKTYALIATLIFSIVPHNIFSATSAPEPSTATSARSAKKSAHVAKKPAHAAKRSKHTAESTKKTEPSKIVQTAKNIFQKYIVPAGIGAVIGSVAVYSVLGTFAFFDKLGVIPNLDVPAKTFPEAFLKVLGFFGFAIPSSFILAFINTLALKHSLSLYDKHLSPEKTGTIGNITQSNGQTVMEIWPPEPSRSMEISALTGWALAYITNFAACHYLLTPPVKENLCTKLVNFFKA
jgi:hypothetical protein